MVAESANTGGRILKPNLGRMSLLRELLDECRGHVEKELEPFGITLAQLRVLWAIELHPEASGSEVARVCDITPQSGQTTIARLETHGWIRRKHSEASDRVLVSELTASGRKLLLKARETAERLDRELWQDVPERSLATTDSVLRAALARVRLR